MNIAICFYGLSSSKNDKGDKVLTTESLNNFKKHILIPNKEKKIDIFLHSWKTHEMSEKKLLELYKPLKHIYEDKILFDKDKKWNYFYSRWNSTSKVLNLVFQEEKKYDYIMLCRFDLVFHKNIIFNFDNSYFYCSHWVDASKEAQEIGLLDYWFISNNNNMKIFSTIFDELNNYRKVEPENYIKSNHTICKHHLVKKNLSDKIKYVMVEIVDFNLERFLNKNWDDWKKRWYNEKKMKHLSIF